MYVLLTICPISALGTEPSCPLQHIEVQQLPDLNIPRAGHFCYYANGEITVIGGHTTGFTPTATAEYYSDGQWHTVPTTYTHDQGLALRLKSGKVMIGGGHAQCMGVEQTYGVESYDLAAHSSGDYGCLSRKRCFADAVELDSGRVFITGNWYHQDDIECYDGNRVYSSVADVHAQRSCPYLLRTSASDAIVFSALDIHGNAMDTIVVENMKGQLIDIPLLREWRPYQPQPLVFSSASAFIGDASKGQYAYLILVQNSAGQLAIANVEGTDFSILPTTCPIPRSTSSGQLHYSNYNLLADRQRGRAYLVTNNQGRIFVLCIEYAHATPQHPAPLTLYYTDSLTNNGLFPALALTPEGNILTIGGLAYDNFTPTATSFMLMLAAPDTASTSGIPHSLSIVNYPLSIIVGCLILSLFILSLFILHRRRRSARTSQPKASPAWTYSVSPIQPTSPQSPQSPRRATSAVTRSSRRRAQPSSPWGPTTRWLSCSA